MGKGSPFRVYGFTALDATARYAFSLVAPAVVAFARAEQGRGVRRLDSLDAFRSILGRHGQSQTLPLNFKP